MENEREHIYLAALLHDIGKFYQRADTGSVSSSRFLSERNKIESTFCPVFNGKYSHKHCLWTAQFIDDYSSVFRKLLSEDSNLDEKVTNLITLAASHHLKMDQLSESGRIVKLADNYSSGMDRDSTDAMKDDQDEKSWDAFKKKRMTSILEGINNTNSKPMHLPLKEMSLTKDFFPKSSFADEPDYLQLWNKFVGEFKFIQANTYRAFSETLLNLLYKYTATIPASTINFPDVSLYDHSKTTAALAICLYDFQKDGNKDENPFLLIGADMSGIQSYIYQIVSKYAGKNLKGRSFYIRLLSDTIVRYLLKELNLFQANVVYNSGGGFYIIAPNTTFLKEKLLSITKIIEQKLFEAHGTSLYIAIDSVEVSTDALMHKNGEDLRKVWDDLFSQKDKKKLSKFSELITENYDLFFAPQLIGGLNKRDVITGEEFKKNEKEGKKKVDGKPLKEITSKQIELGAVLKDTDFIVVAEEKTPYWKDVVTVNPLELGFHYYFVSTEKLEEKAETLSASADKVSVITLNGKNQKCDFIYTVKGINNIYGFEFYGGNKFENDNFEKMCTEANFTRLGVLRMDVDNLGSIFQSGIPAERATLSSYSVLSRSFDYFFSGYLNTIWEEVNPKKSFIIYSGGDDVFIVGSWEVTIQLAKRIVADFKEFTCNNPAFSLSGGIAFVPVKFPIMKAAEQSDVEEKLAKNHICGEHSKNSLSFMNMPLNWLNEFPAVENLKDKIVELIEKHKLTKSFISKVLSHKENALVTNHVITKIKTFWMLTYDLSRMKVREKDNDVNIMIDNCITEVCGNKKLLNGKPIITNYHVLELWAFAARWAELEIRTKN